MYVVGEGRGRGNLPSYTLQRGDYRSPRGGVPLKMAILYLENFKLNVVFHKTKSINAIKALGYTPTRITVIKRKLEQCHTCNNDVLVCTCRMLIWDIQNIKLF